MNLTIKANKTLGVVGQLVLERQPSFDCYWFAEPNQGHKSGRTNPYQLGNWSTKEITGLVDQHITLFPTTIMENIRYGNLQSSDDEVKKSAEVAEAIGFIESLPNKWETMVGEGGHRLSGGQRQRIAINRAVLKDALFLLDEATSAVDNETEAALQRSIEKISKSRTTVIIAHRLSTIRI